MPLSRLGNWYVPADHEALWKESGLTHAQIGSAIGVSARTVFNYINGETRPKSGMAAMFAKTCGASEKRIDFLVHVINQMDNGGIVSDLNQRNIFIVERAEATYGEFWKWEPWYIPGPLQSQRYHMEALAGQDNQPMQQWQRKLRRQINVLRRKPGPTMRYLIGTNAIKHLAGWEWGPSLFANLVEYDRLPNCEIRVLDGLHRGAEHAFEVFLTGGRENAGPPFVYVETFDQSRHIEEPVTFSLYHDQVKELWSKGSPIGRSLDDWVH